MPENLVATASTAIAAPVSTVWAVITDAHALGELMMGATIETDWQVGSTITWSGEYQGTSFADKGEILQAEPERKLVYTHVSGSSGEVDAPENRHTLTWTLHGADDHTVLTLSQDNNHSADEAANATQTWEQVLAGIKRVAEET